MKRLAFSACFATLLLGGCGDEGTTGDESVSEIAEPILSGTLVSAAENPGVVALYNVDRLPNMTFICSGTLIRRRWVLTARHCVTADATINGAVDTNFARLRVSRTPSPPGLLPPSDAVGVVDVIADTTSSLPLSPEDIALVRLAAPISGPTVPLFDDGTDGIHLGLAYSLLRAEGFGMNILCPDPKNPMACCIGAGGSTDCGTGALRSAELKVVGSTASEFNMEPQFGGQLPWRGDSGGPAFAHQNGVWSDLSIIGVHSQALNPGTPGQWSRDVSVPFWRSWIKRRQYVPGDVNKSGRADIVLTGVAGWGSMPAARAQSSGSFSVVNTPVDVFPAIAATPGVKLVTGDFNGDGYSDVAATGVSGWTTLPVALHGTGNSYTVVNQSLSSFPGLASNSRAKALRGDFNGDGFTDVALTGVPGWTSVPVALSNGDGTFVFRNNTLASFPTWAGNAAAKPVSGDFDGDGRDDIALVGVAGWTTVPVAYGFVDGTFHVHNEALAQFPALSGVAGVKPISGDFNGDGRDDIALTGVNTWTKVPIAFGRVTGLAMFSFSHQTDNMIPSRSTAIGVKILSGDFNADRKDDLAFTGTVGQNFIGIAYSNGDGTFNNTTATAGDPNFYVWASQVGAVALSGQDHR